MASADAARLDARVLLWPMGAKDVQHPPLCEPEVLTAGDGITHHIHNRGNEVALSVHVFGT